MVRLKIVMLSTLWERTPPPFYGGTERVVSYLTEELVKRGHDVTLFATGDSKTKAKLISFYPRALYRDKIPWTSYYDNLTMYSKAVKYAGEIRADIIHSHGHYYSLPLANLSKIPIVHTLHGNISKEVIPEDKRRMLLSFKDAYFVSISNSQRKIKELNYVATVYNGIPYKKFDFNQKGGDYLLWLGRITYNKGAAEAVKVAKALKRKLILAGKIDWAVKADNEYFEKEIKPHLKKSEIEYVGEVDHKGKNALFGKAKVLLNLINWDEPFGLVPAEANACGTPVIANSRGAMTEIIKEGVNGFLVKPGDIKKAIQITQKVFSMPENEYVKLRRSSRNRLEENFTVEKMVDGYEKVYEKVIKLSKAAEAQA